MTLLALSACGDADEAGGSSSGLTKDNITQRTTNAMLAQGSMHIEMAVTADDGGLLMIGDQVMGADFDSTKVAFDYTELGADDMPTNQMSVTVVDGLIFANLGESSDDKYVRVDPTDTSSELGAAFAPMLEELDVTKSISKFADAITSVSQEGADETFDGVKTTPYRVTVDVDRAVASGALDEDTQLRAGGTIVYTFYIDSDDLLRRMKSEVDSAVVQVDVTKFGEPVEIVAPPAEEVIEESEFNAAA